MSKRIEQPRQHGHDEPDHLVLVPQDLPAGPDIAAHETFIGPARMGLLPQQAPLATEERVQRDD